MDMLPNGIAILRDHSAIYHNQKTSELLNIPCELEEKEKLERVYIYIYIYIYIDVQGDHRTNRTSRSREYN